MAIFKQTAHAKTPAGRLVTTEDVAHLVAFLRSPEASMIRSQIVNNDGGATLLGKLP